MQQTVLSTLLIYRPFNCLTFYAASFTFYVCTCGYIHIYMYTPRAVGTPTGSSRIRVFANDLHIFFLHLHVSNMDIHKNVFPSIHFFLFRF